MDVYSLVDTAIKIGLGALITGVGTYCVAKLNHERELKKIGTIRKIDLIEKVSEQAELYFYGWQRMASSLGGIYSGRNIPTDGFSAVQWKKIKERDEAFLSSKEHVYQVIARLRLLGANEAANLLGEMNKSIGKFRDPMILKRTTPTHEEFKKVREEVNEYIKKFHGQLCSLYSDFSV